MNEYSNKCVCVCVWIYFVWFICMFRLCGFLLFLFCVIFCSCCVVLCHVVLLLLFKKQQQIKYWLKKIRLF